MPIFEYRCRACAHQFEALTLPSKESAAPACPSCHSLDLEKLLSSFAVDSDGSREAARAGARKKAKATTRDKLRAQREYEDKHHRD